MFKKIVIELTGPICSCPEGRLSWSPGFDDKLRPNLTLSCTGCDTRLVVPHSKLVASFSLDVPYPGKKEERSSKPKLTVMDGGKLIQLDPTPPSEEKAP